MAYYRLYHLGGPAGRIISVEEFGAPDDESAIRRVEGGGIDGAMELWCLSRKVRKFPTVHAGGLDPRHQADAV